MTEYVLNALFGLVIGFVGGYAGISGAPFLVFLLGAFLGYSQHLAQGTVVAMMLGPMSLLGVWVMWDRVKPLLGYVAVGVLTYATFSYLGAAIAYLFSSETLRLLFAVLVLALGLRYVFQKNSAEGEDPVARPFLPFNLWTMALLGAVVGVIGGMFGIGAGVVMVPVLWLLVVLIEGNLVSCRMHGEGNASGFEKRRSGRSFPSRESQPISNQNVFGLVRRCTLRDYYCRVQQE